MYCVRCRQKTPNSGKSITKMASNGRRYMQTNCSLCGGKKTQFVSSKKGGTVAEAVTAVAKLADPISKSIITASQNARVRRRARQENIIKSRLKEQKMRPGRRRRLKAKLAGIQALRKKLGEY